MEAAGHRASCGTFKKEGVVAVAAIIAACKRLLVALKQSSSYAAVLSRRFRVALTSLSRTLLRF